MPFQKGQSGNPGGRPKAVHRVEELARSYTDHAIKVLISIAVDARHNATARVAAANALLDRGWGKPMAHVEMTANVRRDISDLSTEELIALAGGGESAGGADEATGLPH